MFYVLTILVTFHGVTTKFDLDPRLTKWGDEPRCQAIGDLLREDLGDADRDHVPLRQTGGIVISEQTRTVSNP